MAAEVLGTRRKKFLFMCQGAPSGRRIREVAGRLVAFIGMTSARRRPNEIYPYRGRGGRGLTHRHPLTESYVVADVYADLGETEILISTCRPERLDSGAVAAFLDKEIGPTEYRGCL